MDHILIQAFSNFCSDSHMEKTAITTLCCATMQQWRVVKGKTMHYNSYFMLCHNATLESGKWYHEKMMLCNIYFMQCNNAAVKSSHKESHGLYLLHAMQHCNNEDSATWKNTQ